LELRSAQAGAFGRLPGFLVAVFVVTAFAASPASAGPPVAVGSTSCSSSFTSRSGNLDCSLRVGGLTINLAPSVTITGTTQRDGAFYGYDLRGKLVSATPASGETTTYSYNQRGRLVEAIRSRGDVTRFAYDEYGRVREIAGSDGTTRFSYDAGGDVIAVRDAATGETAEYSYDDLGRPIGIGIGRALLALAYDGTRMIRASGTTTTAYTYDSRGNVVSIASDGESARLIYDARGNVSTIDGSGLTTRYDYDQDGRIAGRTTLSGVTRYSYDARQRLLAADGGSGDVTMYDYDTSGGLRAIANGGGPLLALDYTANGMVSKVSAGAVGPATDYGFDDLGRLVAVSLPLDVLTVVDFEEGDPDEPYVVGTLYWKHEFDFLRVGRKGRLLDCRSCP